MSFYFFFFFNDTATTEIYTLSLHDALPIFLNKNKQLNKLNNIEIIKIALNNKKGKVKLYKAEINKGGHSLKSNSKNFDFEMVEGKKFDDVFSGKVKEIDLLKIDAEGVEFEILEGAKNFLKNKKYNCRSE